MPTRHERGASQAFAPSPLAPMRSTRAVVGRGCPPSVALLRGNRADRPATLTTIAALAGSGWRRARRRARLAGAIFGEGGLGASADAFAASGGRLLLAPTKPCLSAPVGIATARNDRGHPPTLPAVADAGRRCPRRCWGE